MATYTAFGNLYEQVQGLSNTVASVTTDITTYLDASVTTYLDASMTAYLDASVTAYLDTSVSVLVGDAIVLLESSTAQSLTDISESLTNLGGGSGIQQYAYATNDSLSENYAFSIYTSGLSVSAIDPALIYMLNSSRATGMDTFYMTATSLTVPGYTFAVLNINQSVTFNFLGNSLTDYGEVKSQIVMNEPVTFLYDSSISSLSGWTVVNGLFPNGSLYTSFSLPV